jgi:hypothetical protein
MECRHLAGMSFECNADETIRITFASVCADTFLLEGFRPLHVLRFSESSVLIFRRIFFFTLVEIISSPFP